MSVGNNPSASPQVSAERTLWNDQEGVKINLSTSHQLEKQSCISTSQTENLHTEWSDPEQSLGKNKKHPH